MSRERWFKIYERELTEAEERGVKHPEEVAAELATQRLRDIMADEADQAYDWDRDERLMGNRP